MYHKRGGRQPRWGRRAGDALESGWVRQRRADAEPSISAHLRPQPDSDAHSDS